MKINTTEFEFSKQELKGLIFIMACTIAVSVLKYFPGILQFKPKEVEIVSFNDFEQGIKAHYKYTENTDSNNSEKYKSSELFYFDPNKLDLKTARLLGLSNKQSVMIANYVSKGGKFYNKEDFKKIYSISEKDYERLAPWIKIRNITKNSKSRKAFSKKNYGAMILNLNTADSVDLISLPGIGPYFSSQIIKYRTRLGGFYSVDQLMEVYGMDESRFFGIKDHFIVDTSYIEQLNINTAEFKDLIKYPYLSKLQAKVIINYRKHHGSFVDVDDILDSQVIDSATLRKVKPYLCTE